MTENTTVLMNEDAFDLGVHRIGRITILTCIILSLAVPFLVWMLFGIMPPSQALINGIITVSSFMIPLSIAEILAFYPILGSGGLYISYTTGNISNLKLPCAAIGMEAAEVEPASKEGRIISIIAMSGSVIVLELMLVLGVILLVPLSGPLQNPTLKPAFDQVLPALFGSLGAYFILKNYKLAIIPLALGIIVSLAHIQTAIAVPVCVLISILAAKTLYKKGWIKP
jgi:voltage-gated potassium channel Kch